MNHSPPQESLLLILAHRHSHSEQLVTSIPSMLTMSAQLEVLLLRSFANAGWDAACTMAMMSQSWTGRYFVRYVLSVSQLHGMWWHYSFPERSTMVPIRKLSFSKPEKASSLTRSRTLSCLMLLSVLCMEMFMMRYVTNLRTPSDRHFITGELRLNLFWHPSPAHMYIFGCVYPSSYFPMFPCTYRHLQIVFLAGTLKPIPSQPWGFADSLSGVLSAHM